MSLTAIGTPCSGPSGASLSMRADSDAKWSTIELIAGSRSSMRPIVDSSSSVASSSPAAIACACARSERSCGWSPPLGECAPVSTLIATARRPSEVARDRDRARAEYR